MCVQGLRRIVACSLANSVGWYAKIHTYYGNMQKVPFFVCHSRREDVHGPVGNGASRGESVIVCCQN
jgi:hypothetical protein